jgi:hypothetical protein
LWLTENGEFRAPGPTPVREVDVEDNDEGEDYDDATTNGEQLGGETESSGADPRTLRGNKPGT